jgi:hypothetical protein
MFTKKIKLLLLNNWAKLNEYYSIFSLFNIRNGKKKRIKDKFHYKKSIINKEKLN